MLEIRKRLLVNMCLLLVSSIGSLAIGYAVYSYIVKKPPQSFHQSGGAPYDYSFFNQKGRKISDLEGMFKLVTDPFTIYQNYPNQKSANYLINKYGFREGYTSEKPYTAILMGGSAAFGYALDNDNKMFSSLVNVTNEKYNIINSSVIGFMSSQELSQMIHYLDEFRPKLYILFNGWNDVAIPYDLTREWPVVNPLIGYNPAFTMIEDRLADYLQMTRKNKETPEVRIPGVGTSFDEALFSAEITKRYTENVSKMRDFAYARGAEFLLVFQPELGNKKVRSKNEQEALDMWASRFGYLERKIPARYKLLINEAKKSFQEKRIPILDINAEPEFSENPQTLFFDVVHPNDAGHQVIASILNHALATGRQHAAVSPAAPPAAP